MAEKQLYATGTFKYQNRMLQAGEPVNMPGPHQRLYTALGKVTDEAPKKAAAPKVEAEPSAPVAKKAPAKRAPRKKAAKKPA